MLSLPIKNLRAVCLIWIWVWSNIVQANWIANIIKAEVNDIVDRDWKKIKIVYRDGQKTKVSRQVDQETYWWDLITVE